jgi:hypothetical protein
MTTVVILKLPAGDVLVRLTGSHDAAGAALRLLEDAAAIEGAQVVRRDPVR